MDANKVRFFDTTLRDGEKAPGYSMNIEEKVRIARQLEALGIDVIEAGFAIASQGDFASVEAIAGAVSSPVVASLSRALVKDIDAAWAAVKGASRPRIHTFLATSDLHLAWRHTFGRFLCKVTLEVNNLLDQQYDVIINYPMPGRNFNLTMLCEF